MTRGECRDVRTGSLKSVACRENHTYWLVVDVCPSLWRHLPKMASRQRAQQWRKLARPGCLRGRAIMLLL